MPNDWYYQSLGMFVCTQCHTSHACARWRTIIVQMINYTKKKENATDAKNEENNTKG